MDKRLRILVLGARGQLGHDMTAAAVQAGHDVLGVDLPECDITDRRSVMECVTACHPTIVVNCAAYTAVDECEKNTELAFRVNRDGAENAAAAANQIGATFVHISTDYVFDGSLERAYVETDSPNPLSVYGKSKLAGEKAVATACPHHQIVRTAWLYGRHGSNFVKSILRNALRCSRTGLPLRVVNDQRGTPTWSLDLCRQILLLAQKPQWGIFHATSDGACTWFEFAVKILSSVGISAPVHPCTTSEFPRPAPRPRNSVLENARLKELGLNVMPPWDQSCESFLALHGAEILSELNQ